jgi:hypothetical protein
MLRIFVTSSHISVLLQLIYARNTKKPGDIDILLIDYPGLKKSLIDLILESGEIYKWDKQYSFAAPFPDETNIKPGFKKSLTRKLKTKPVIKQAYDFLLKRHAKKRIEKEIETYKNLFSEYTVSEVELNMMTKTGLNESLIQLYPRARINYFEHGMGDYYYIEKTKIPKGDFYCVFADTFAAYLRKKGTDSSFVHSIPGIEAFKAVADQAITLNDKLNLPVNISAQKEKLVFILMESVEVYQVPDTYWSDYIDLCISRIKNPSDHTFVVKPHHLQSFNAIDITRRHFEKLGITAIFIDETHSMNLSAEVLFGLIYKRTDYVFSLFSSSIYYLSKLYPEKYISYYYGYDFFKNYLGQSPMQFIEIFNGIEEVVKEVLSVNCKEMP